MKKNAYDFGEKTKEKYKSRSGWEELEVWQTPKYLQSKDKAIELLESKNFNLDVSDFWILKNKGGTKLCYTGLIISHNGCLKINDALDQEMKFKPSCVNIIKDEGEKSKVMSYICDEQGVYEFGEISPLNCKNDYPWAMVLKRLMDRVILKNSKIGFSGIYSEEESEEFKRKDDSQQPTAQELFVKIKEDIETCEDLPCLQHKFKVTYKDDINKLKSLNSDIYERLLSCKDVLKEGFLKRIEEGGDE